VYGLNALSRTTVVVAQLGVQNIFIAILPPAIIRGRSGNTISKQQQLRARTSGSYQRGKTMIIDLERAENDPQHDTMFGRFVLFLTNVLFWPSCFLGMQRRRQSTNTNTLSL
jgi:hypothetical protein